MRSRARPLLRTSAFAALTALTAVALTVMSATPAAALNDQLYGRQWGLTTIGANAAWDRGILGAGVEIAIVDSGVHLTHQDLVKNLRPGANFVEPSKPPQDDECSNDDCGHGTHVAGIAAASIDDGGSVGVAPRAGIVPLKVLDSSGSGSLDNVAAAIKRAADGGAEAVNLSLGPELGLVFDMPPAVLDAIRYAWAKGSICVIAAGNDFVGNTDLSDVPAIVVSATNRSDTKADFSTGVGNSKWALAAPGGGDTIQFSADENIWSTVWTPSGANDTYGEKRGTSMAAPFVSGAVALLRSAGLSPQQTVDRLLATAKDLGAKGRDSTYGSGRLDVGKATEGLSAAGAPAATAPPAATSPPTTATASTTRQPGATVPRTVATTATAPAPAPATSAGGDTTTSTAAPAVLMAEPADGGGTTTSAPTELAIEGEGTGDDGVPMWLATLAALAALAVTGAAMVAARRSRRAGAL